MASEACGSTANWRQAAQRWLGWLTNPSSRDPQTGHWWSWVGDGGYPYPEATAWALLALAEARRDGLAGDDWVAAAGDAACAQLALCASQGGLGRSGRLYTFDTAVGLAAVHAWQADHPAVDQLWRALRALVAERRAVHDGPRSGQPVAGARWSEVWGAHLLWVAVAGQQIGETAWARQLARELVEQIDAADAPSYSHALAYACEGLVALRGEPVFDTRLGVWWKNLRRAATPIGGRAFTDGTGPVRSDVTAQMVRLQKLVPSTLRDGSSIGMLVAWTNDDGAVRYEPTSVHANTWCTAMALRAAAAESAAP